MKTREELEAVIGEHMAELARENEESRSEITEHKGAEHSCNLELATLNAVAQALSTSLELQDVLAQALSRTAHALEFAGGLIALANERTGDLVLSSYTDLPLPLIEHLEAQGLSDTLCDFVYREGKPLGLEDLRNGAPVDVRRLLEAGLQSYVGAPIVHKSRALGSLCLFDTAPHPVSETGYALLTAIGQQIGVAVENARLFSDVVREREVAQTLLDTAGALSTTLQIDKLLDRVLDELQRVVPYDAASITMLRDERCWTVASRGLERIPLQRFSLKERPLVRRVVHERGPVIVPHTRAELDWIPVEGVGPVRSWLGVPLITKDGVIGVLTMDSYYPYTYDEEAARLAFAFAHQVALAMDNSRLYEQTRSQLRETTLLHDVMAALSSTLDVGQALPYVARSLCEVLNGTSATIYSLDEETHALTVVADYAASESTEEERRPDLGQTFLLTDSPVTVGALVHRRPVQVRVNGPKADPRERAMLEAHGAQAVLFLPMVARGRVLGFAQVWETQFPRHFTEGEIAVAQTLVRPAAIVMENARLFEEVEAARVVSQQRAEALEEANARLQELDRLKDQFLAHMSHELRTPLGSIMGFSEVMIDGLIGELTPKQKKCVRDILSSAEHLLALINDVLDLSKIKAGRMSFEPTTFEVAELLTEVQSAISPLIENKSQVLAVEQADDLPPLTADRLRVKQVLLNLLSNANKFTPAEGSITMSCRLVDSAKMLFSVADTGIGIEPEDQEIIFEEFRQANGASKLKVKGTGLGLAISKRLIEMQGGRIWVKSEYGHGATFSFLLPLTGSPAPEPEAAGTI